jgi:hypothetical protein
MEVYSMASSEQKKAVAASCWGYRQEESLTSSAGVLDKSCENCGHWDGEKCIVDLFDKVLTGLDQE